MVFTTIFNIFLSYIPSRKRGIIKSKIELLALLTHIALNILNMYSKLQLDILNESRDIKKCPSFSTHTCRQQIVPDNTNLRNSQANKKTATDMDF